MSEAETVDRLASVSLAELDRRVGLTRDSGRLDVQEQLDWGEALLASGDRASARVLIEGAWIQQGFSPQLEAARADMLTALGLDPVPRAAPVRGNTVDNAIAELRAFARRFGGHIEASSLGSLRPVAGKPGLHPTATLARGASRPSERGVAALVGQAVSWLRSAPSGQDEEAGAAAVEALRGSEREPARWTTAGLAGAETAVLANAVAAQQLRAFLRAQSDLLLPRLGSPALFHAAAMFNSMGLGPFFGNVSQIVRGSVTLFELATIAMDAAETAAEPIVEQAWLALLSRNLSGWLRFDFIDELGDRNASFALTVILERATAVAADDVDRSLVARIRDAALDNLDYDLAGMAQGQLVGLSHDDWLERRIMGIIQASAGRIAAADQLLSACLEERPGDEGLAREVMANRERRYAPFALLKGYGSPLDRQLKRIGARGGR